MKKIGFAVICIILIISLCGCRGEIAVPESTAVPSATATPTPVPSPTPNPTPSPTPVPTPNAGSDAVYHVGRKVSGYVHGGGGNTE